MNYKCQSCLVEASSNFKCNSVCSSRYCHNCFSKQLERRICQSQCENITCIGCGGQLNSDNILELLRMVKRLDLFNLYEECLSNAWIQRNTRKCPGCHASIQKDGGCEHMVCICSQKFNWT